MESFGEERNISLHYSHKRTYRAEAAASNGRPTVSSYAAVTRQPQACRALGSCMLQVLRKGGEQDAHITWSVAEHAWRQSRAALHSGSFTHAKIWGPQLLIMRAIVSGPDALKLSKRSTCRGSAGLSLCHAIPGQV